VHLSRGFGPATGGRTLKADDIFYALEEAIVRGAVPPGSLLRQERLAADFDVSRTPIREALRRLEAIGLVSLVENRGARVRSLSADDVREAFLVRAELEGLAADRASSRINAVQLATLVEAEDRFRKLTDELRRSPEGPPLRGLLEEWSKANDLFHETVLEAANAPRLIDAVRSCRRLVIGHLMVQWNDGLTAAFIENAREHKAVRELLELGSGAGARAAMAGHVRSSGALLEATLFVLDESPITESAKEAEAT
jgi:DNA-binding GntR family transcriptional regulator